MAVPVSDCVGVCKSTFRGAGQAFRMTEQLFGIIERGLSSVS